MSTNYYSFYPVNNNPKNFINSKYALDIAIESHFSNLLLEGDLSRVVYSSNAYAMRRWVEDKVKEPLVDTTGNTYNLPFFNYRLKPDGIDQGTNRPWFSNPGNTQGVWIPELQKKIRILNITMSYEATLWVTQEIDALFAINQFLWDDSNETILPYYLELDSCPIKNIAVLSYDADFSDDYWAETDWLEKNSIRTVSFDFSFETFLILENDSVTISEEIILDFLSTKEDIVSVSNAGNTEDKLRVYFS